MSDQIVRLNPPRLPDAASIGYSQISVVEAGRLAFISGQVALAADGSPIPEGLAEQARIVAQNARAALDAIDAGPENIVMARAYVTNLTPERLEAMMPPMLDFFDGAQPSLTGIGVAALAAPEFQIELEMIVQIPAKP